MHIKRNTTYPNTAETTKLGAMRTQPSIPQFLHTNETSENLSNALETKDTVRFSDYTKSSGKSKIKRLQSRSGIVVHNFNPIIQGAVAGGSLPV